MFDKFEAFMNKYLTPLANKMDKQVHLSAIKKSMVALTPLLIIGSFCLIPEAIPNMIGAKHPVSVWILKNLDLIYIPYNVGMALMSVYVSIIIAYHLANSYKQDIPGAVSMALISFFIMKFTIKMPESVPDFVSRSFEMIPLSVIVIGFFLIVRIVCINVFNTMPPLIFTKLFAPLVGSMDNPIAYLFLRMLQCLLFFFGIHPSVLSPITSPISTQFLADNIAASLAKQPLPHFYCPGPESAFGNFTGTGVTIGLVFWCLLSKNKALKQVGRVALIPALFGINEPILFGAPIVLNPIFFIPYVIFGGIIGSFGGFAMYFGIMEKSIFTPPYVGVFLEGYLTNFDMMSIVVNAAQMIASIVVWYPFFKIYEKRYGQDVKKKDTNNVISDEDAAILDDLDLDF